MTQELVRNAKGQIVSACVCGSEKSPKRRMCPACEANPTLRAKNLYVMAMERERAKLDEAAERETRNLPGGPPLIPALLNKMIDDWGR